MALKVKKNEEAKEEDFDEDFSEESEKKEKTAGDILKAIEKRFGKGSAMYMNAGAVVRVPCISTGSMKLDQALMIGGLPKGRIVEIYGKEMSGKTTLLLQAIANAQKNGEKAAFIDAEHALSLDLAQNLGVEIPKLLISQPDYGEQALEIVEMLVKSGEFSIIGVDSVAALVPKSELEGEMGDAHVGLQARLMSQAMRKLTGAINKSHTCVVFINQIRSTIGGFGWGPKSTTTGGNALKFYSSVRIEVKPIGKIKLGEDTIGNKLKIQVTKNKLAPPFRTVETDLIFGKGTVLEGEILDIGMSLGIIEKKGSWYNFGKEKLGQGKQSAFDTIRENEGIRNKIMEKIEKSEK